MSKDKNPRRVADNEARAKLRMLRTSPQKLNLVAGLIRGKKVEKALNDLTFSKKRIAIDVKKCLQSAVHQERMRTVRHQPRDHRASAQKVPRHDPRSTSRCDHRQERCRHRRSAQEAG